MANISSKLCFIEHNYISEIYVFPLGKQVNVNFLIHAKYEQNDLIQKLLLLILGLPKRKTLKNLEVISFS